MQTINTPNTPYYWRIFYITQEILLKELSENLSSTKINNLAHKITTKLESLNEKV